MVPEQFKAWRKFMRWTQTEAAARLGISRSSIELYEAGMRRGDDRRPVIIPRIVALACSALTHGLDEWTGFGPDDNKNSSI